MSSSMYEEYNDTEVGQRPPAAVAYAYNDKNPISTLNSAEVTKLQATADRHHN